MEDMLHYLKDKFNVKHVNIYDDTFTLQRQRVMDFCALKIESGLKTTFNCAARAEQVDLEMLKIMKKAGCWMISLGIETGDPELLKKHRSYLPRDNVQDPLGDIREKIKLIKKAGIRVKGLFMMGLPGETEAQARKTIQLALELPLDYAAFNVAVPRAATQLRKESIAQGLIDEHISTMDQSGIDGAISTQELSAQQILVLRKEALIRFYLRPGYLLRRLFTLRSWTDFVSQIADGWGVVMDALKRT